jgi:hypothetical protein
MEDKYLKNPAEFTLEWAGGSDKGCFKRYDKEKKENVFIKDIEFYVLQEAHSLSGYSKRYGSCFSNECQEHSEEKHLRVFEGDGEDRKANIKLSGLWKDIKYEAQGKYGAKFTAVVYACLVSSSDEGMPNGSVVRILLKGCSLSPWIDFGKKKTKSVKCSSFKENQIGEGENAVKFRSPIFEESFSNSGYDMQSLSNEVQDYLKKKRLELLMELNEADGEMPAEKVAAGSNADDEDLPW